MENAKYFIVPLLIIFGILATIFILRVLFLRFVRTERTCPIWSETLNLLMDADAKISEAGRTTKIGPVFVWTSDWPTSYGHEYISGDRAVPDYATQKRLRDYISRKRGIEIFEQVRDGN